MARRGLNGVTLVISDAHEGLQAAIRHHNIHPSRMICGHLDCTPISTTSTDLTTG